MGHFSTVVNVARLIQEKERKVEESFYKKLESSVRKDKMKQKALINSKLATGKPLSNFEKWFMTQPEYYTIMA